MQAKRWNSFGFVQLIEAELRIYVSVPTGKWRPFCPGLNEMGILSQCQNKLWILMLAVVNGKYPVVKYMFMFIFAIIW